MRDFIADATQVNPYGYTGWFSARTPTPDMDRPGELRVSILDYPNHGGNQSAGTYISYDEAERLRNWLSEWLVENWPQEEDTE